MIRNKDGLECSVVSYRKWSHQVKVKYPGDTDEYFVPFTDLTCDLGQAKLIETIRKVTTLNDDHNPDPS